MYKCSNVFATRLNVISMPECTSAHGGSSGIYESGQYPFTCSVASSIASLPQFKWTIGNSEKQPIGITEETSDGNVVSTGVGNVLNTGDGNVVSNGDGNVVNTGDGNVVSTGYGNVVSTGVGNVLNTGVGNVVSIGDDDLKTLVKGEPPSYKFIRPHSFPTFYYLIQRNFLFLPICSFSLAIFALTPLLSIRPPYTSQQILVKHTDESDDVATYDVRPWENYAMWVVTSGQLEHQPPSSLLRI